jgi:hypothetical protein
MGREWDDYEEPRPDAKAGLQSVPPENRAKPTYPSDALVVYHPANFASTSVSTLTPATIASGDEYSSGR